MIEIKKSIWKKLNTIAYYNSGKVCIGLQNTVAAKLEIRETSNQLRLSYNTTNYVDFEVNSSGQLHINSSGDEVHFYDSDLMVSTDLSTSVDPRILGFNDFSSGECAQFQFGDAANVVYNCYSGAMQICAYHTLKLIGDRNSTAQLTPDTTSNIGVWVKNTTAASPALAVDGASSQTGNLVLCRTNSTTTLFTVDSGGRVYGVGFRNKVQTLTDGATININLANGYDATVTVAGNRAIAAATNISAGASGVFTITCDGTARTLSWNAIYRINGFTSPSTALAISSINKFYWHSPDGTNIDMQVSYGV